MPARCMLCHSWPSTIVCHACLQLHAQPATRCEACAVTLDATTDGSCPECLGDGKPPLAACHAALSYQWPWRDAIDAFKFGKQPGWAPALAARMAGTPAIVQAVRHSDVLVPMPLHPLRLAERGFNQTLLLTRALRRMAQPAPEKARLRHDWLQRRRHTAAQSSLSRDARLGNLHQAFAVPARQIPLLRGAHAVLLDDVMTTGATLQEAALALHEAGCASVQAVVLARAEKPRSGNDVGRGTQ